MPSLVSLGAGPVPSDVIRQPSPTAEVGAVPLVSDPPFDGVELPALRYGGFDLRPHLLGVLEGVDGRGPLPRAFAPGDFPNVAGRSTRPDA